MNHKHFQRRLSEFVDKELSAPEERMMDDHVKQCVDCARIVAQVVAIRKGIRESANVELSGGFSSRTLRAGRLRYDEISSWMPAEFIARRTVLALSLLVLLIVGLTSFNVQQESVSVERYLSGEMSDSAESRILFNGGEISKDDVLMAAVSKQ